MKTYKLVDFYGSVLLIVGSIVTAFILANEYALLGYFIVGGWQLISMIVHERMGLFNGTGSKRRRYHILVLIIIALTLVGLLVYPVLMIILFVLLFAAPFMAGYYAFLCYSEIELISSRPLAQLR